jgi:hypothetical protein
MSGVVRLPWIGRKIKILHLGVFAIVITFAIGAYASSVSINTATDAGYQGNYLVDNGFYSVGSITYNVNEAAQSASAAALAWSNTGTIYGNALVAGNWGITFVLTINAGGLTSHIYTVTVTSTSSSGSTSQLCQFTFTSPATITPSQTMTTYCDTGSTTWTAPSALQVTVA